MSGCPIRESERSWEDALWRAARLRLTRRCNTRKIRGWRWLTISPEYARTYRRCDRLLCRARECIVRYKPPRLFVSSAAPRNKSSAIGVLSHGTQQDKCPRPNGRGGTSPRAAAPVCHHAPRPSPRHVPDGCGLPRPSLPPHRQHRARRGNVARPVQTGRPLSTSQAPGGILPLGRRSRVHDGDERERRRSTRRENTGR